MSRSIYFIHFLAYLIEQLVVSALARYLSHYEVSCVTGRCHELCFVYVALQQPLRYEICLSHVSKYIAEDEPIACHHGLTSVLFHFFHHLHKNLIYFSYLS